MWLNIHKATCEAKTTGVLLKFYAAIIDNHYYSIDFLENVLNWVHSLSHHIVRKKIPYCDPTTGGEVAPVNLMVWVICIRCLFKYL